MPADLCLRQNFLFASSAGGAGAGSCAISRHLPHAAPCRTVCSCARAGSTASSRSRTARYATETKGPSSRMREGRTFAPKNAADSERSPAARTTPLPLDGRGHSCLGMGRCAAQAVHRQSLQPRAPWHPSPAGCTVGCNLMPAHSAEKARRKSSTAARPFVSSHRNYISPHCEMVTGIFGLLFGPHGTACGQAGGDQQKSARGQAG